MPVYKLAELGEEYVTPKHSTAFGSLVTGEQVELGVLRFVPHSLSGATRS